jgi:hypothetical protein
MRDAKHVLTLQSDVLFLRMDIAHGGEITDLVEVRSGRQLLAHSPFSTSSQIEGDVAEDVWLSQYRGGWQLLTPNAGNLCFVEGRCHGYHGAASNEPWALVSSGDDSALIEWRGHGLKVRREVRVLGASTMVRTTWDAEDGIVPFLAVEHLALGPELLDPDFQLQIPAGRTYELSETAGPFTPPDNAPDWPFALLADGSLERADSWSYDLDRSRFLVAADLPVGWAEVRNPKAGLGVQLEWDIATLPHAWLWHEMRRTGGRWRGCGQQLMIEPASLPHSLGLEAAVSAGQARFVGPGDTISSQMTATIVFT